MSRRRRKSRNVVYILAIALGLYLFVCYSAARSYISPLRVRATKPEWVSEVEIPTAAGPDPTWATPGLAAGKGGPVVFVLAHGYGGSRQTWSDLMRDLPKHGIEAIAPSMPGQDASPDKTVGFSLKESDVILDAVKWVRARYAKPPKVVLMGLSMGGAATWIASAKDPTVDGVITDSAYARFDEAMNQFFERKLRGGSMLFAPVIWMAKGMTGLQPEKVVPLESAAKWKKPALVIQGDADTLIVPSHAERLAKASKAQLWIVPGAEHAQCYDADPTAYLDHLVRFAKNL